MSQLKALIFSDLHLEFAREKWLETLPPMPHSSTYDLIIIAGDVGLVRNGQSSQIFDYFEYLNQLDKPVLFVPGNHEYYDSNCFGSLPLSIEPVLRQRQLTNIYLLCRQSVEIDGTHFIGATLWSNWGCPCNTEAEIDRFVEIHRDRYPPSNLSDFQCIGVPDHSRLTLKQQLLEYKNDYEFIEDALSIREQEPCVVITHHSPSNAKQNANDGWSKRTPEAYSSALDDLIRQTQPLAWIHGHIHNSLDYNIAKTRVICNPRGYLGYVDGLNQYRKPALNPDFNPQKIVQLGISTAL